MLPTVELPPLIPLTCQLTTVSVVLTSVAVKICVAPVATLLTPGHTATCRAGAAREQTLWPATDGAFVVADVGVITTFAVSVRPASSVTVRATVPIPQVGATMVALELPLPRIERVRPPLTGPH